MTTPRELVAQYATQAQLSSFFVDKMGIASVSSYGATGDGVTDDTSAIQSAIDNNSIIFIPATSSSFKITSSLTVTKSLTIFGVGYASYIAGAFNEALIKASGTANVVIYGLRLGNTASSSSTLAHNIRFMNCTDSLVERCFFTAGRFGVRVDTATSARITIRDNWMESLTDGGVNCATATDLIIANNTITDCTTSGLSGPPHYINCEDCDRVVIEGNIINAGSGLTETSASGIQVTTNSNPSASNVVVIGNVLRRNPVGTNVGIILGGKLYNVAIQGNIIEGFRVGVQHSTITAGRLNGLQVLNNCIYNSQAYGILMQASSAVTGELVISGNTIIGPGNVVGAIDGIRCILVNSISITENRISNCYVSGISIQGCSGSSIIGNVCRNNNQSAGTSGDGIFVTSSGGTTPDNNIIANNSCFDDQDAATQYIGIYVAAGTDNLVVNNRAKGNTNNQIYNSGTTTTLGQNWTKSGVGTLYVAITKYTSALSPAAVAANTTAEQTFTVSGLTTSDTILSVTKPTAQAGLGIVGWRISGANTLALTFSNNTGTPITPTAAETYTVWVIKT